MNRKEGDRVGLLRSKGEDDITSDQFEDEGAQSCSDNVSDKEPVKYCSP